MKSLPFFYKGKHVGKYFFLTNTEVANLAKYTVYVTAKKEKKINRKECCHIRFSSFSKDRSGLLGWNVLYSNDYNTEILL